MTDPIIANEMKRCAVIVALKTDFSDSKIACFSKLQDHLSTIYVKS